MSAPELARQVVSRVTRKLSPMRGLGRVYRRVNSLALKLNAPPIAKARMSDGTSLKVDLRSSTEMEAYYTGLYDAELLTSIGAVLDVDRYFLDIGANIGFYSVAIGNLIRTRGGAGKVIAFEPLANNYQRLLENIAGNDLTSYCETYNIGLSEAPADSVITLREDFKQGSGTGNASIFISEEFDDGFVKVPIKLETLDGFWTEQRYADKKIDFIKMDIEGHEDFCLKGGRATVIAHRPTILMEVNKPYYQSRKVDLDAAFLPLLPKDYLIYRQQVARWQPISSLNECDIVDNVFFVPKEKLEGKYIEFCRKSVAN